MRSGCRFWPRLHRLPGCALQGSPPSKNRCLESRVVLAKFLADDEHRSVAVVFEGPAGTLVFLPLELDHTRCLSRISRTRFARIACSNLPTWPRISRRHGSPIQTVK